MSKYRYTVFAILVGMLLLIGTYFFAYRFYFDSQADQASARALLNKNDLVAALERFQHLPYILAQDPAYEYALQSSTSEGINQRLENFTERAGVEAIYLMDARGLTIASSNAHETPTFVGQNYAFRPYFRDAMNGQAGEFFAIGATTSIPGYFISEGVTHSNAGALGVLAVKVNLNTLVSSWRESRENIFVTDQNGIVVLASNENWRYKTVTPLDETLLRQIKLQKQFGNELLPPLEIEFNDKGVVRLDNKKYIISIQEIGRLDWNLHYLAPLQSVVKDTHSTVLLVVMPFILLLTSYLAISSGRIRNALEKSRDDQKSLHTLNLKLEQEVEERKITETRLENAQKNLRQASKLAALGQLSASVSHELGQPISALQNYLASAQLPGSELGTDGVHLLDKVSRITKRIRHITNQLQFFAHPADETFSVIDLADMVHRINKLKLIDFEMNSVKLTLDLTDSKILVMGDRMRLEQVLINLLKNAIDATSNMENPGITIRLVSDEKHCNLSVVDNGRGIDAGNEDKVLEPFFTTKASGDGIGLGLAISNAIMEEHGGALIVHNAPDGGAEITMRLPLTE